MAGSTALYVRKSTEDFGDSGVSESIENQILFLQDYCKANAITETKTYIDDGISGTTFNRPGFTQMISDIEKGLIDTIITKDYSRLGRDYIQSGYYLEKYFPEHNIRYIAVNDGIDTAKQGSNNDMAPFRAVFNDMYAKDISIKVRTALTTKKKNGQFIGSSAPFGYKKSPCNKNQLIIDTETAPYVCMIFQLALQGESFSAISDKLSSLGVPTPSESKKLTASQKRFKGVWNEITVKNILTSETYIGNLTQNRTQKINYKIKKKRRLNFEEWITVNNTHEGIINADDFYTVQKIISVRTYSHKSGQKNLLSGLCFCADCFSPMTYHKSGNVKYLVCSAWKKHAKLKLCHSHSIREDYVLEQIKVQLRNIVQGIDIDRIKEEKSPVNKTDIYSVLQNKIECERKSLLAMYKDKINGVISEEDYQYFSIETKKNIESLNSQINTLSASDSTPAENVYEYIENLLTFEQTNRETLALLISKVLIDMNKNITIEFNFKEPEQKQL